MTAKQFLEERQAEHFNKFGIYADTNSKIAEWMEEYSSSDRRYHSVNRVEVINHSKNGQGREYTKYGDFQVEVQVQDNGKTLKIFLSDSKEE